jgi:hypothetical protein
MRKWAVYLDRGGDIPSLRSLMRRPKPRPRASPHPLRSAIAGAGATRQAPKDDL